MPFSPAQIDWLAMTQRSAIDYDALVAKQDARNQLLTAVTDDVSDFQDELAAASKDLTIEWPREKFLGLISRENRKMDWNKGDRDAEVDTKHDLKDGYQVDDEAVKRMNKLHDKLVALQKKMEDARDADGNPLFDIPDITRELWTPLVQADIIPSNAVADKYSQEAQVFNGACEIYKKKLEDYTANASKYDDAKRVLRIGTDAITLLGSLAGDVIKIDSFAAQSMSRQDYLTLAKDNADKANNTASPDQLANIARMTELKQQMRDATLQTAAVALTVTVLTGGLSVIDAALTKPDDKRRKTHAVGIATAVFNTLGAAAANAISIYSANTVAKDADKAFTTAFQTQMNIAAKSAQAIVAGGNIGRSLYTVTMKLVDGDYDGAVSALTEAITGLATAIGTSISAVDVKRGTDANGEMVLGDQGKWQQLGLTVQGAILAGSSIPKIMKHIADAVEKDGGKVDVKVILANIGFSSIAASLAGAIPKIAGNTYSVPVDGQIDMGSADALWQKTQTELDIFNNDADAANELAAKAKPGLDLRAPKDDDESVLAAKKLMAERENARKAKAMSDFKKTLADPERRDEFFNQISDATERELEVLNELLDAANTPPQDLDTVAKEQRAMAAMDKLIAEAQACNMKWQALEIITGVGAAVLAAALPGAGMAVAIQKLLIDATTLVRKSVELNKWMDNMALTVGNSSVYGPAINGRLNSARVQVSLQSLRVLYDALGVTAESIKLADASGVSMGGGLATGIGIQVATSMARALTEFAYKVHKEGEIEMGWHLYKAALESPGDRKKARTAMKWNSTLSKCVIAYGIVMDNDPIAKEVGRSCGITPEVLCDEKAVCQKVVTYFETLYSDDPVVLKRIPIKKDWHPGAPTLTLVSWLRFKAAAMERATPPLAAASAKTPAIDRQLTLLGAILGPDCDYDAKRDSDFPEYDPTNLARETPAYGRFLNDTNAAAKALVTALRAYKPVKGDGDAWVPGTQHDDFIAVAESLTAQAQMIEGQTTNDLQKLAAHILQRDALQNAAGS